MPKDGLIRDLSEKELNKLNKNSKKLVLISVCASVFVCSIIALLVALYLTNQANQDSLERGIFNCNLQHDGRVEGNKRLVYELVEKEVIESHPALLAEIKKNHPEWYPLPAIHPLPIPNCAHSVPH